MDVLELVAAWHSFVTSALDELDRVAPDQWRRPSGYQGWSTHDLLAHLSSTQKALPRVVESAFAPPASLSSEPFDPDRWNASQIRRRADEPASNLIAEFEQGGRELEKTISERVKSDADLQQPVPGGAGFGRPLGVALAALLEHQRQHLADLLAGRREPS